MSSASRAWMKSSGARPFSVQKASALPIRPATAPRICSWEGMVAAWSEKVMSILSGDGPGHELKAADRAMRETATVVRALLYESNAA